MKQAKSKRRESNKKRIFGRNAKRLNTNTPLATKYLSIIFGRSDNQPKIQIRIIQEVKIKKVQTQLLAQFIEMYMI